MVYVYVRLWVSSPPPPTDQDKLNFIGLKVRLGACMIKRMQHHLDSLVAGLQNHFARFTLMNHYLIRLIRCASAQNKQRVIFMCTYHFTDRA